MRSGPSVSDRLDGFRAWAVDRALPLWSAHGFDQATGLFEEQLSFEHRPVTPVPRRVMVQARQIGVYAMASLSGLFDGRAMALTAGARMLETFWARDGEPGWVFSVDRGGAVVDGRRDLYAQAFVLFALSWLVRLSPEARFLAAIDRTIAHLEDRFADRVHGGYWDALPRPDRFRRQNPHMHLLEAFLALHEATGDRAHLGRASALVDLACGAFADAARGTLRETFDDRWQVVPGPGQGSVEPGHLFEWAWLLRRYDALAGTAHGAFVRALVHFALAQGVDRAAGRIVDELGEDGGIRKAASRCWPHAEALKSLSLEMASGEGDFGQEIGAILDRLLTLYCPARLAGGWIDQLSEDDRPLSTAMPASTLYHLILALTELDRDRRSSGDSLRRTV